MRELICLFVLAILVSGCTTTQSSRTSKDCTWIPDGQGGGSWSCSESSY